MDESKIDSMKLIATFSGAVIAVAAVVGLTAGTVEYVSAQVHEVKNVKSNVMALEQSVAALQANYTNMSGDIAALKGGVAVLEANYVTLTNDVDAIKAGVEQNATRLEVLDLHTQVLEAHTKLLQDILTELGNNKKDSEKKVEEEQ